MQEKGKGEIPKLLLFLTQVADSHQYALMVVSYPEAFVSLATIDCSHKALLNGLLQGMPTSTAKTRSLLKL